MPGGDLYTQLPLVNPSSIRLLWIHQSPATEMVQCSLRVANLSDKPRYHALSYTWGPPTPQAKERGTTDRRCCPILCNGRIIHVTVNLHDFLQGLARGDVFDPYWIDAICLNQDDVLERNRQVLNMANVYANAFAVVIWLGQEDEYTMPALKLLDILGSKDLDYLKQVDPLSPFGASSKQEVGLLIEDKDWEALAQLFKRTWFSRIWILQECRMARAGVYFCGNNVVDQQKLYTASAYITSSPHASMRGFTSADNELELHQSYLKTPVTTLTGSVNLVLSDMFHQGAEFGSHFGTAIIFGRGNHCSDPRDKVYGLMGFHKFSNGERETHTLMSPDYRKPISQVYLEAAQHIMESSDDFFILSLVEDKQYRKLKDLPSWAPDFSVPGTTSVGHRKRKTYRGSRALRAQWQLREGGTVLALAASFIDTVTRVGESKVELVNENYCQRLLSIVAEMGNNYINGQSITEALWRTLVEDTDYDHVGGRYNFPAPKSLETSFRSFWLYIASTWLGQLGQKEKPSRNAFDPSITALLEGVSQKDIGGLLPSFKEIVGFMTHLMAESQEDLMQSIAPYNTAFDQLSYSRFFRTGKGYLGMGPMSLEVGDSIWLVPGSEVLIVLRVIPGSSRYALVVDCFVHGLMDGEAVDDALSRMQMVELA